MAEPALPLREGEGSSAVGNGEGCCPSWLFLMNGQKNPTSTMRHKSHSLRQPLPKWCCSSEHCCLLRRQILGLATRQRLPPGDTPRGAQLLCCRMPESLLKMLQVETGVLFTTGGLLFIGLGLRKEKVIDFGSTLRFCSAFLVFRTAASCRNGVFFGIEVDRQM